MTWVSSVVESIISTLPHARNHRERNRIQKRKPNTSQKNQFKPASEHDLHSSYSFYSSPTFSLLLARPTIYYTRHYQHYISSSHVSSNGERPDGTVEKGVLLS